MLQRWGVPVEKTSYDDFYLDVTPLVADGGAGGHGCDEEGDEDGDANAPVGADSTTELAKVRAWPTTVAANGAGLARDWALLVAPELRRGVDLAVGMRRALALNVGLTTSVGVGRSKLVARMLSPLAKPDGVLVLPDAQVEALMHSRRVRALPGLQQQRGRLIAERVATTLRGSGGTNGGGASIDGGSVGAERAEPSEDTVTLGDAMRLSADALSRCVGRADAELLTRLARADDSGAAVVARSSLPKQLASECSFPPTNDHAAIGVILHGLCATLWKRLLAERTERRCSPLRLVVSWREGYPNSNGGAAAARQGESGSARGASHSRAWTWPPTLGASLRRGDGEEGEGAPVAALTASARGGLVARLPPQPQLTRLIVAADFGSAGAHVAPSDGTAGSLRTLLTTAAARASAASAAVTSPESSLEAARESLAPSSVADGMTEGMIEVADEYLSDGEGGGGDESHEEDNDLPVTDDLAVTDDVPVTDDVSVTDDPPVDVFDEFGRSTVEVAAGSSAVHAAGGVIGTPAGAACPLCGAVLPLDDNALVNSHIDACLGAPAVPPASAAAPSPRREQRHLDNKIRSNKRKEATGMGSSVSVSERQQRTLLSSWVRGGSSR